MGVLPSRVVNHDGQSVRAFRFRVVSSKEILTMNTPVRPLFPMSRQSAKARRRRRRKAKQERLMSEGYAHPLGESFQGTRANGGTVEIINRSEHGPLASCRTAPALRSPTATKIIDEYECVTKEQDDPKKTSPPVNESWCVIC